MGYPKAVATSCGDITGPATSLLEVQIGPKRPFTRTGRELGGYSIGTLTYSGIPTAGTSSTDDRTANDTKAINTWSIRAQGRAIRRLPQTTVIFGKSKQPGFFWSTTGLRREGAILCHVASKNTKGNSCGPFILEGVTDRGRQKRPPRVLQGKKKAFA